MTSQSPFEDVIGDLRRMLAGEVDLIVGIRALAKQRWNLPVGCQNILLAFVGFESETDSFPEDHVRQLYAPEFLARLDAERRDYLADYREHILSACRDALRKLTTGAV